jgi:hypothetical protein
MEPLDTDLEYVVRERRVENTRNRFYWLLVLPGLGLLWLLYLTLAVIFQLPVSGVVNPVMSIMIVFFCLMVGLLFWALAPKANRE